MRYACAAAAAVKAVSPIGMKRRRYYPRECAIIARCRPRNQSRTSRRNHDPRPHFLSFKLRTLPNRWVLYSNMFIKQSTGYFGKDRRPRSVVRVRVPHIRTVDRVVLHKASCLLSPTPRAGLLYPSIYPLRHLYIPNWSLATCIIDGRWLSGLGCSTAVEPGSTQSNRYVPSITLHLNSIAKG
jgi:hypothetical protein